MTDNVIPLGNFTRIDLPVERVLDLARNRLTGQSGVVVIGWDENGELSFTSTFADGGEVLWLLEKAKQALLEVEV